MQDKNTRIDLKGGCGRKKKKRAGKSQSFITRRWDKIGWGQRTRGQRTRCRNWSGRRLPGGVGTISSLRRLSALGQATWIEHLDKGDKEVTKAAVSGKNQSSEAQESRGKRNTRVIKGFKLWSEHRLYWLHLFLPLLAEVKETEAESPSIRAGRTHRCWRARWSFSKDTMDLKEKAPQLSVTGALVCVTTDKCCQDHKIKFSENLSTAQQAPPEREMFWAL